MHPSPAPVSTDRPTPLYEDDHLLAFDKPSGLLCVPGRGPEKQDCLSSRVQAHWPEALIVHRLDMATSGIVLMARHIEMQRAMSAAFGDRQVHKIYEAIVGGHPATEEGAWNEIDAPIQADWERRPIQIVSAGGKQSITQWKLLERLSVAKFTSPCDLTPGKELSCARLSLRPITGRTHQLRVHLLHHGFPILGDSLYAPEDIQNAAPRLLLHACLLQFSHPVSGVEVRIECPVPF